MRTRAALAAAAILTGMLVGPTTAVAAALLCQGKEATIVAGPTQHNVTGTDAADVIVAQGSDVNIDAGAGDDTVCMNAGFIQAGSGNDSVTSTSGPDDSSSGTLGPGDDIYVGGAGEDNLSEGDLDEPEGADTISTGAGSDHVSSGRSALAPAEPNRDVIDLGPGRDVLTAQLARDSDATFAGGSGEDEFDLYSQGAAAFNLDLAQGLLTRDVSGSSLLSGFEYHVVTAAVARLNVYGSPGPDSVGARVATASTNLGGGADKFFLSLPRWSSAPDTLIGGPGRDILYIDSNARHLTANLESHELRLRGRVATQRFTLYGYEGLNVEVRSARLRGDAGRNWFFTNGCPGVIDGAGGDDVLLYFTGSTGVAACHAVINGGAGDDRLRGGSNGDVLVGGGGLDEASGKGGSDHCVAERETSCER